jgi:glycosyltransferase involved in cell wall biosynthesis
VPVDLIPTKSRLSPPGILAIRRYMKEHQIDLVHTHMYRSNVPGTVAAKLAGVPLVVAHIHNVNTFETRRQLAMDKFLNRWRDAVICVSNSVYQDHVRHTGLGDDKALVLYNGTDTSRFGDTSLRNPARESLGLKPDETAIFFAGRIANNKNPDIFIEIARRVVEPREKARFMIVGDGPRREDIEVSFKSAGLIGKTQFLGFRHDIPDLLQAADIAVLPSFKEGFSIAVIETLASGTPLVATDVGGTAEAIEDGKSGIIVPARDDQAILNALEALVDDPERRIVLSAGAVERAQTFSLENTVSELEALYLRLSQKIANP